MKQPLGITSVPSEDERRITGESLEKKGVGATNEPEKYHISMYFHYLARRTYSDYMYL